MKFSIVIPIYNCEEYLSRCLDSVVYQNYSDYELILVDDGSTDHSLSICQEYKEKHPQIKVIHQNNSGPSMARNTGLSEASGDYLLFVDSDDYVSDSYFSVLDQALCESDQDIIMFGSIGSVTGASVPDKTTLCGNKNIISFYSNNCYKLDFNSCWNKCFKRSTYYNQRFPEKTVVEEDLIYNLMALDSADSMRFLNVPLYYYNQRSSGSVTTKYNPNKFDCAVHAYTKKKEITQRWNEDQVIDHFKNTYLIMISAAINNLLYKTCPLKHSEKIEMVKAMYDHSCTHECAENVPTKSGRVLMMKFLVKYKLIHTSYFVHWIVFHVKKRA